MAHITRFEVEGLTGRVQKVSRTLARDVNVFFGLNGSGKTSLLKILHSAMANDASILERVPFARAQVQIHSADRRGEFTRTISRDPEESQKAEDAQVNLLGDPVRRQKAPRRALAWASDPPGIDAAMSHQWLPTSRIYPLAPRHVLYRDERRSGLDADAEEVFDSLYESMLTERWLVFSTQTLIDVSEAQEEGLAAVLRAVLSEKEGRVDSPELSVEDAYVRLGSFLQRRNAQSWLPPKGEFLRRYESELRLRSVALDIGRVEARIEAAMLPRTRLQGFVTKLFGTRKKVTIGDRSLEVKIGDKALGLGSLSSGEKHVLRLLIDTVGVAENCLMVDEPEISLHIDWQRDLLASMQEINPQAQLIVATHSPEIMADVSDEAIFRLV